MARKGGLGKGLDALVASASSENLSSDTQSENGSVLVPTELVFPNPRQPRQKMNEDSLQELADSIREHGVIQPLIVTYETETTRYILIAGERRLRASKLAGLEMVPVLIRQATEQQRLELALIENVQRADLTPLETAEAYRQLSEEFNLAHDEIARRVGKSRVAVTNTLRLLKAADAIRKALAEGEITEGHARALVSRPSHEGQVEALRTVLRFRYTVRQTEDLVRRLNGEQPQAAVSRTQPDSSPEVKAIEDRLRTGLGTKVTLQHGQKGGSITIHYYSDEELDTLIGRILKE